MTDRATLQALIEQGYAARQKGDVEAILALFHPDGRFHLMGAAQFTPVCGLAAGQDALRAAMGGLVAGFAFLQRDIVSLLIDGEQAAVHSHVTLRAVASDKTVTTDILDLWKFRDGKILELVEFADTALINSL